MNKEELQKHYNFLNDQHKAFIKAEFDKIFAKNRIKRDECDRRLASQIDIVKLYLRNDKDLDQIFISYILEEHGPYGEDEFFQTRYFQRDMSKFLTFLETNLKS